MRFFRPLIFAFRCVASAVLQSSPESFYSSFDSFWENGSFTDLPVLKKWFDWYLAGKHNQLFEDYSSYNYGGSNAESAF